MNTNIENNISVCMITATLMEAEPFILGMDMREAESTPFPVYKGGDSLLIISGIGKTNAALATACACMKHDPLWILNPGAAGAVRESEEPGRIYHIEKTVEPDRIHLRTLSPYVQHPDSMDGFDKAILATQDKAITDVDAFREISAFADLVDMEGASVVQASRRFGKRCLLFKFVTDTTAHAGRGNVIMENVKRLRWPFGDFMLDYVIPVLKKGLS